MALLVRFDPAAITAPPLAGSSPVLLVTIRLPWSVQAEPQTIPLPVLPDTVLSLISAGMMNETPGPPLPSITLPRRLTRFGNGGGGGGGGGPKIPSLTPNTGLLEMVFSWIVLPPKVRMPPAPLPSTRLFTMTLLP